MAVEDPQPVANAVQSLVTQHGDSITYEDPPYVYQGDLVDRYESGVHDRIPAGHAGTSRKTRAGARGGKSRGHFRVVQTACVFHVMPAEVKDGPWELGWAGLDPGLPHHVAKPGAHGFYTVGGYLRCCWHGLSQETDLDAVV